MTTRYTVGDTLPPLRGTVSDDGAIVSGVGAASVVHIRKQDKSLITRTVTVAADGTWSLDWEVGDLSVDGTYYVEVQVTFPSGGIETFGRSLDGSTQTTFTVGKQIA